jgi:hypothetical protein
VQVVLLVLQDLSALCLVLLDPQEQVVPLVQLALLEQTAQMVPLALLELMEQQDPLEHQVPQVQLVLKATV